MKVRRHFTDEELRAGKLQEELNLPWWISYDLIELLKEELNP